MTAKFSMSGLYGKSPKRARKKARNLHFGSKPKSHGGPGVLKGIGSQSVWKGFGGPKRSGGLAGLAGVMSRGHFGGKKAKSVFSKRR